MLAARDVVGIAQTGTGKTAAFVLPLLQRIAGTRAGPTKKRCSALILVPTRELAAQVDESIRVYGRFVSVTTAVVVGGLKPRPQIRALAPGVDIVIATPGRLEDHLGTGAVRLDRTTTLILDEADQMLDLGFAPAIRRIANALPKARQTVLLSATMPKPIRALARDYLDDPVEIAIAPNSVPVDRIRQQVIWTDRAAKRDRLIELLKQEDISRAIVFTRTKHGADRLSRQLRRAGLSSAAIHGDRNQNQRSRALEDFRTARVPILVATDIAARGIDIDDVSHVVNFELPNVPQAYVHRIGRTARAGSNGTAISLCDASERGLLKDIERLIGRSFDPDAEETAVTPPKGRGKRRRGDKRAGHRNPSPAEASLPNEDRSRVVDFAQAAAARGRPIRPPKSAKRKSGHALKGEFDMQTGSVKWFNATKGYGFIAPDDGGADVFVHISAVERSGMQSLNEGQKVSFEVEVDPRRGKSSATNLRAA